MVLKSMGKIGTRRGRSIVVRDDIDKTVSGRRVRQGIGKLMKLQAKDYHDPDGAAKRRWRLQHVREHVRVFVEDIALRARVQEFCDSLTDAQRDDVMKIVPRMVEGPWVAKHAVGQKPALLGHAITTAYHSGPGWFEMDVDVSSSSTAAGALRILKSCSKSLVMDLAFVLEGQTPDALPEKILGTVEWNHFDLDPDNSPVIKVCGEDN